MKTGRSATGPPETLPDTAPSDTAPSDTAPSDTAPSDTAPSDTAPPDTAPSDTAPSDTAPSDTAPSDTAPSDTAPSDTAPPESAPGAGPRRRALRSDAAANRERVLAAAVTAILRDGPHVPLAVIAAEAGVGVGTLYRSYTSREDLLGALQERAYAVILDIARDAESRDEPGIVSIDRFLERAMSHRGALVLPLHGGPVSAAPDAVTLRTAISDALERIMERGRRDGSIRADATAIDVILMGAMLLQPLLEARDWERASRRQKQLFLDGLAATAGRRLGGPLTRSGLEAAFARRTEQKFTGNDDPRRTPARSVAALDRTKPSA
jgi:AcrR family transcriptional regulator